MTIADCTSLMDALRILYRSSVPSGLVPFVPTKEGFVAPSFVRLVYAALVFIINLTCHYHSCVIALPRSYVGDTKTRLAADVANVTLSYIAVYVSYICIFWKKDDLSDLLNRIIIIDKQLLTKYGSTDLYSGVRTYVMKMLAFWVILHIPFHIYGSCFLADEFGIASVTEIGWLNYSKITTQMQICTLMLIMWKHFKILNTKVMNLFGHDNEIALTDSVIKPVGKDSKMVFWITSPHISRGDMIPALRELMLLHTALKDISLSIIQIMGPIIVAEVTSTFFGVTAHAYIFLTLQFPINVTYAYWMLMEATHFAVLALFCHFTAAKANQMKAILQKLTLLGHYCPMEYLAELHFQPCGLFHLNASLLCSFVGVVTTYVVILVQLGST